MKIDLGLEFLKPRTKKQKRISKMKTKFRKGRVSETLNYLGEKATYPEVKRIPDRVGGADWERTEWTGRKTLVEHKATSKAPMSKKQIKTMKQAKKKRIRYEKQVPIIEIPEVNAEGMF